MTWWSTVTLPKDIYNLKTPSSQSRLMTLFSFYKRLLGHSKRRWNARPGPWQCTVQPPSVPLPLSTEALCFPAALGMGGGKGGI